MNDARREQLPAGLLELTEALANGAAGEEEVARLERLLLEDAGARAFFRRYMALDSALRDYGSGATGGGDAAVASLKAIAKLVESSDHGAKKERRRLVPGARWLSKPRLALAASVLVVFVGVAAVLSRMKDREAAVGTLRQVTGDVRMLAADGQVRGLDADTALRPGDTILTRGSESSVVLAYDDGTRLTLVGDTSITGGAPESKTVVIHKGTVAASVRPQGKGHPMVLATPAAKVQVLGTRFLIEAAGHRTDLRVSEGRVRLTRVSDGGTLDVLGGKQARVTDQNKLKVEDIPALSPSWSEDFEEVPAEGWRGQRVTQGLPAGSGGGIRGVPDENREDGSAQFLIGSNDAWAPGLFAPRKNSHLHFTFKVESTNWINILIVTRTAQGVDARFSGNYLLRDFPKGTPGEWNTVSIPLARFERIHSGEVPLESVVPYMVVFSATAPDRGLVIDRIWVTPDGPGELELKPAP